MSGYVVWFIIALGLGIVELLTGTFYVLVIGFGFAAAGVAAWLGAEFTLQAVVAALVGFAGVMLLRRTRFGRIQEKGDVAHNPDVNLDIGQTVQVEAWSDDGTARAWYRGAQWDVQLEEGAPRTAGACLIKAVRGNRLILAPSKN